MLADGTGNLLNLSQCCFGIYVYFLNELVLISYTFIYEHREWSGDSAMEVSFKNVILTSEPYVNAPFMDYFMD